MPKFRRMSEIVAPTADCNGDSFVPVKMGYNVGSNVDRFMVAGEVCYSKTEGRTWFIHTKHEGK